MCGSGEGASRLAVVEALRCVTETQGESESESERPETGTTTGTTTGTATRNGVRAHRVGMSQNVLGTM